MSRGRRGSLAWGLGALGALAFVGAIPLLSASTGLESESGYGVVSGAMVIVFGGVGALIASRHPRNATGWILCGAAVWVGVTSLADSYARYWLDGEPSADWLGELAAALSNSGLSLIHI